MKERVRISKHELKAAVVTCTEWGGAHKPHPPWLGNYCQQITSGEGEPVFFKDLAPGMLNMLQGMVPH